MYIHICVCTAHISVCLNPGSAWIDFSVCKAVCPSPFSLAIIDTASHTTSFCGPKLQTRP